MKKILIVWLITLSSLSSFSQPTSKLIIKCPNGVELALDSIELHTHPNPWNRPTLSGVGVRNGISYPNGRVLLENIVPLWQTCIVTSK